MKDKTFDEMNVRLRTTDVIYLYYAVKNYVAESQYKLAQVKSDSDIGLILDGHISQGIYLMRRLNKRIENDLLSTNLRKDLDYWKKVRNDHKRRN